VQVAVIDPSVWNWQQTKEEDTVSWASGDMFCTCASMAPYSVGSITAPFWYASHPARKVSAEA
jgi:hypothetical protein